MKKLNLKSFSVDKGEVLSRSQLKNVLGGDDPVTTGGAGRCVLCQCDGAGSSCWYSTRSALELCQDVCGPNSGGSYTDPWNCYISQYTCIMN
ncbi:hypothetical protein [Pedobacter frigoris]|uniref:hypothetical protein n=1 Tax=Pedobacter frigoris TaxID=2571272 RepID=UPI00397767A3